MTHLAVNAKHASDQFTHLVILCFLNINRQFSSCFGQTRAPDLLQEYWIREHLKCHLLHFRCQNLSTSLFKKKKKKEEES